MARLADRLPDNVAGDFYVDQSCIDCDTCREVAPAVFGDGDGHARVCAQPLDEAARRRALMALVACPVAAIGTVAKPPAAESRAAAHAFPEPVPGIDGVYSCGYASESSYGASSWLIVRPGGNVLVDSPRAARPLMESVARLGGVGLMFLTHRDDVADHEAFAARFGCQRVMHKADVSGATRVVERQIEGDAPVRLADDLTVIPTPGHTRGSACLLWRDVLFTGDHLWWSASAGHLAASRSVCWYSWKEQVRSIERLLGHAFRAVLPGHGARLVLEHAHAMRAEVSVLAERSRK